MTFCCDPFEPLTPEEQEAVQAANSNVVGSPSGAMSPRGVAGNNAGSGCVGANNGEDEAEFSKANGAKKEKHLKLEPSETPVDEEILVSVTLPPGVSPGQKIEVRSPDGRRTVDTVVPEGLEVGQTFLVRFPPTHQREPVRSLPSTRADYRPSSPRETRNDNELDPTPMNTATSAQEEEEEEEGKKKEECKEKGKSQSKRKKKTLSETLERLLIPTPDPPTTRQEPSQDPEIETPVNGKKPHSLPSSPLKRVEGSPVDATVTPVETRQEGDDARMNQASVSETEQETDTDNDDIVSGEVLEAEGEHIQERKEGISLVKSLEDFLTPKPDKQQGSDIRSEADAQGFNRSRYNQRLQQKIMQRHKHGKQRPHTPRSQQQQREPYQYPLPMPMRSQDTGQKLVQVQVPPGMAPGSTIFVEIPGENRTVGAQVPPNVTTFHVAYTPQGAPRPIPPPQHRAAVVMPPPRRPPPQQQHHTPSRASKTGREKLLSVKVPPGTPPGTTLHVSVPDEPGRILAAKVPPGNVTKFHVSYVPTEHHTPTRRSMLPPANPYLRSSDRPRASSSSSPRNRDHHGDHFFGNDSYMSPMGVGGGAGGGGIGLGDVGGYGQDYSDDAYNPYQAAGDDLLGAGAAENWGGYGY